MTYIPNTDVERAEMLKMIGVNNLEDLISNIPPSLRIKGGLNLPEGLSEFETGKVMRDLAQKNMTVTDYANFIGAGAYDHITPSIVDFVISRPEFYTAYTPYQAELSQGTLQAMYEFQTSVSLISGLDISNASMYDGASALAEAALMAMHVSRKNKILVSPTIHPHYIDVVKTYLQGIDADIQIMEEKEGNLDLDSLAANLDDSTACVLVQHPNFYGCLEEVDKINDLIKQFPKVQYVVSYNPVTVGLLKSPGDYGADIAVAEGQPLGIPLSFGGPYIGLFSTKEANIRKMPGRMAGKTIDTHGKEGFVLALQTREQHIKRERATSNICTNQGLMAVAVLTYLSYLGKKGLVEVANLCYNNAHYLASEIEKIPGFSLKYKKEFFHEFVLETDKDISLILSNLQNNKIFGGLNLDRFGQKGLLVAVTEKRTKEEMDSFVELIKNA